MIRKIVTLLGVYGCLLSLVFALQLSVVAKEETINCSSLDGWYLSGGSQLYNLYDFFLGFTVCLLAFVTVKILWDSIYAEYFGLFLVFGASVSGCLIATYHFPDPLVACQLANVNEELISISRMLTLRFTFVVFAVVVLFLQALAVRSRWRNKKIADASST